MKPQEKYPIYRNWFNKEEYEKEIKKVPPKEWDVSTRICLCEDPLDEMKFDNI